MPLARIDLIAGKVEGYRQTVGDVVHQAMVDILKAPKDDRFQVINEHPASNFIFDPHFFGIERSGFQQINIRSHAEQVSSGDLDAMATVLLRSRTSQTSLRVEGSALEVGKSQAGSGRMQHQ
jgi:hypothetical protein